MKFKILNDNTIEIIKNTSKQKKRKRKKISAFPNPHRKEWWAI